MLKLAVLLVVLSVGALGAQLPAGVSHHECPNFPYCGAGQTAFFHGPVIGPAIHSAGIPIAASTPADVSPAQCPNFPFCGPTPEEAINFRRDHSSNAIVTPVQTVHHVQPVAPVVHHPNYPADISPAECPNFPFCGPTPVGDINFRRDHSSDVFVTPVQTVHNVQPVGPVVHHPNYPADISPAECPNFPFCGPTPAGDINFRRDQNDGSFVAGTIHSLTPVHTVQPATAVVHHPNYPADIMPSQCPNFPYCGPTPTGDVNFRRQHNDGSIQHVTSVPGIVLTHSNRYPAGVNPATCPNFPLC